jgi:hypothetical protein
VSPGRPCVRLVGLRAARSVQPRVPVVLRIHRVDAGHGDQQQADAEADRDREDHQPDEGLLPATDGQPQAQPEHLPAPAGAPGRGPAVGRPERAVRAHPSAAAGGVVPRAHRRTAWAITSRRAAVWSIHRKSASSRYRLWSASSTSSVEPCYFSWVSLRIRCRCAARWASRYQEPEQHQGHAHNRENISRVYSWRILSEHSSSGRLRHTGPLPSHGRPGSTQFRSVCGGDSFEERAERDGRTAWIRG